MRNTYNIISLSNDKISRVNTLGNTTETLSLWQSAINLSQLRKNVCPCNSLKFKRITMSDIPKLVEFFKIHSSRSCDYSIGGILMWTDYFDYKMDIVEDTLFIKGYDRESDTYIYYEPIGNLDKKISHRMVASDMSKNERDSILITADESSTDTDIDRLGDCKEIWKEYLYDIDKFLNFSGKKMEKKRNHLNYFIKHYSGYTIEKISDENIDDIIHFTEEFEQSHSESDMSVYESLQTIVVLKSFKEYPFEGILIKYNGEIIAYSFGEKIKDTFFLHVEKANISYEGVYQAIASFMSRYIKEKYPDVSLLNREEDMGIDSLRKSKESYHPSLIINKKISYLSL